MLRRQLLIEDADRWATCDLMDEDAMGEYSDLYDKLSKEKAERADVEAERRRIETAALRVARTENQAWIKSQLLPLLVEAQTDLGDRLPLTWKELTVTSPTQGIEVSFSNRSRDSGGDFVIRLNSDQSVETRKGRDNAKTMGQIDDRHTIEKVKSSLLEALSSHISR